MKTLQKITILIILLSTIISSAQEKLKGNREVTSVNRDISDFYKIEVIDNLTVELVYDDNQEVIVKTDSNLQNAVLTEVINGTLTIKTSSKITRKKELTVILKVNNNLKEIYAYNNAKVISENLLKIDSLTINAFDNSDFELKLNSTIVDVQAKKTSDLKIDMLCNTINVRCEENSDLKGNYTVKKATVELIDKASMNLSGNSDNLYIETSGNSTFKGRDFEVKTVEVKSSNNSDAYINCTEAINIYSNNNSEIYIYSNPKITISEFFDKASLYKRELDKKLF
ncbi:DUF2807 domain-containing protein [Lutibacter sp. TH_r2]|uniref:GIN domain-containing protein n=1 Tax=Lutibacter sp. TH_r2 TaxID=3082083 RepID=UPI002952F70F|nr:DUF2807 domain-containing protein [Lutibacter sp. TH_r2]MDV7185816.1 DUF2807 domain-containing protein [Lutibacter sp. TH_r2]